jgi:hypothetical protein
MPMAGVGTPNLSGSTNTGICVTCAESLLICLACGQPVRGKYVEIGGGTGNSDGPYCEACYRDRPPCDVCGAPLTNDHWQLSDGRLSCGYCHATAIYGPAEAKTLYEEMKRVVAQQIGLSLNIPTGLALVDRVQLEDIIRQQVESAKPTSTPSGTLSTVPEETLDPQRTLGIYARRGIRRGIYVQTGLPRLLLMQVAAHEYTHAWQGENCPLLRNRLVREGFAEWVAYKILGYYGHSRGQAQMQARTDLYGQGLSWALALESSQGVPAIFEACRMVNE